LLLVVAALGTTTSGARAASGASVSIGGERLWVRHYDGPGHFLDQGFAIATAPDGTRVFETGQSRDRSSYSYATVARDAATGHRLWVARYKSSKYAIDTPRAIAVSPDGQTVYATGESTDTPNIYDFATVAYDVASGAQRWVARFDDAAHGSDTANSVTVSPDSGSVYVTGTGDVFGDHPFAVTIAYDASTGAERWNRAQTSATSGQGLKVVVSPDGARVYTLGARDHSAWSAAYDSASGVRVWTSSYRTPGGSDVIQSGSVSSDGASLYAVADGYGKNDSDYVTIAYDTLSGARRWLVPFDGANHGEDRARSVAVSPDGARVFVTGWSRDADGGTHAATLAYDAANGLELWRRYTPGYSSGWSMGVSPDGSRVVVTGPAAGGSGDEYLTIAYGTPSGAPLWRSRYDGPQQFGGVARALVVDPTGARVFVTGGGGDFESVAYAL
jgi:DNA-binding beta-propeller fold protein YncE